MSSDVFKFILFADDTSLFYSHKNKHEAAEILNSELSNISQWLPANKLSLNVGKSKLLIFTNQKSKKSGGSKAKNKNGEASNINGCNTDIDEDSEGIKLFINGERLKEVDFSKYLRVLIDNKLKWTNQIDAINLKLSKGTGLLAKIHVATPQWFSTN